MDKKNKQKKHKETLIRHPESEHEFSEELSDGGERNEFAERQRDKNESESY